MPYKKKIIKFRVDSDNIVGVRVAEKALDKPNFLFIHGAGTSDKDTTLYLAEKLVDGGVSTFAFDHSGSGESSGALNESSLKKRFEEATHALRFLPNKDALTICGSSMGGYIALKLLSTFQTKNLILFCPAVYDENVFGQPFNASFTKKIRQKDSWKNSDIFSLLKTFTGNLLIFIGENDEIIPKEVISLLYKTAQNAKKREIVNITQCPHKIHRWLASHNDKADKVAQKILEFIQE